MNREAVILYLVRFAPTLSCLAREEGRKTHGLGSLATLGKYRSCNRSALHPHTRITFVEDAQKIYRNPGSIEEWETWCESMSPKRRKKPRHWNILLRIRQVILRDTTKANRPVRLVNEFKFYSLHLFGTIVFMIIHQHAD